MEPQDYNIARRQWVRWFLDIGRQGEGAVVSVQLELAHACRSGRQWAVAHATGGQLRRLARHVESAVWKRQPLCEWNAQVVGAVILGNAASADRVGSFWADAIGKSFPSDEEIACFAYDAVAVWGSTLADTAVPTVKHSELPDMKLAMAQHVQRAKSLAIEFARHTRFLRG